MAALDDMKVAVTGNPYDPFKKPSRQGVVDAFAKLETEIPSFIQNATQAQIIAILTAWYPLIPKTDPNIVGQPYINGIFLAFSTGP